MLCLKNTENKWVLDAKDKSNLYVETFSKKCYLNAAEDNDYSELQRNHDQTQTRINQLEEKDAEKVMATLHEDSGTGPDSLPARILKNCSGSLAKPVLLLTLCPPNPCIATVGLCDAPCLLDVPSGTPKRDFM